MESASKLSALAQPFDVGDALKSWFGWFNLFLEANQIVIAENLHASVLPLILLHPENNNVYLQHVTVLENNEISCISIYKIISNIIISLIAYFN